VQVSGADQAEEPHLIHRPVDKVSIRKPLKSGALDRAAIEVAELPDEKMLSGPLDPIPISVMVTTGWIYYCFDHFGR
jgi:hypothetical protein